MRELLDILRDYYTETLDIPVPARASHCAKCSFPGDEKSLSSITIRQWNRIHKQDCRTRGRFPTYKQHKIRPAPLGAAVNTHDLKSL